MPAETLGNLKASPDLVPALLTLRMIRKFFVPAAERTLHRWISSGQFPRADIALGGKARFWKRSTIEAWIEARAAEGGSQ